MRHVFIFPSAFQLVLKADYLQACVELIAFEYENKESRESKRLNWSSFKEAPYRNIDMRQQP